MDRNTENKGRVGLGDSHMVEIFIYLLIFVEAPWLGGRLDSAREPGFESSTYDGAVESTRCV